jgi:hypothetical protein
MDHLLLFRHPMVDVQYKGTTSPGSATGKESAAGGAKNSKDYGKLEQSNLRGFNCLAFSPPGCQIP